MSDRNLNCKAVLIKMDYDPEETWLGAPFSRRQAVEMAVRGGFDLRWFFKW